MSSTAVTAAGGFVLIGDKLDRRPHILNLVAQIRTETGSLLLHIHHHLGTIHAIRITWEVLYFRGDGKLTAWLHTRIQYRIETSSTCINGSCISRRTATYNQSLYFFHYIIIVVYYVLVMIL